jgi:hypothetical protein
MKTLFVLLISAVISAFCFPAFSQTNLVGPPLGLEWGMSYSEVKAVLKSKGIELEDLKEEKKAKLPKGFKLAKVGKYEILNKKTDANLASFNADGELCAFQINLRFEKGRFVADAEAKRFWHDELKKAITGKYSGEGFKEHNEPDQDGNKPALAFRDEVGNEIGVYFQPNEAWIIIYYNNEEILKATRAQRKATDKL